MLKNGGDAAYYKHRATERTNHHAVAANLNQHDTISPTQRKYSGRPSAMRRQIISGTS